jgi:hypothetical protein
MPPVYPFIELGMGEGIFMGAAKIFTKLKKPIEFSQWAKDSACLISEAGAKDGHDILFSKI